MPRKPLPLPIYGLLACLLAISPPTLGGLKTRHYTMRSLISWVRKPALLFESHGP